LIIECHPEPEKSVSDARQALSLEDMIELVHSLRPIAEAVGRRIAGDKVKPQLTVVTAHTKSAVRKQPRASRS
jgi:3-deoxy-7-phosphoheptulonate synthase